MQHARLNRELSNETPVRGGTNTGPLLAVRTDLSSLFNDYASLQRHENERLEALERDMALLKGTTKQNFAATSSEHEVTRTNSIKKPTSSHPSPVRSMSAPRTLLTTSTRKLSSDEQSIVSGNDGPFSRPLPLAPVGRSKSFNDHSSHPASAPLTNISDEANLLRAYKAHLEQVLRKEGPAFSEVKVPNYVSIEDVFKSNEQLLVENERLRLELNRLRTESILLVRSMRPTTTGLEPSLGNERIIAERERQELAIELARQVEENKRLRRSLLSQSAKFATLRQMANPTESSSQAFVEHQAIPKSAPQSISSINKPLQASKSTRFSIGNRTFSRPRSFNQNPNDPL
ncbi:unnamed protein product [Adineta ricciae]|uniref:Uncharacterized protein n=1 Tax=Adineta ricciae TaxID=249248 RepID=A0A813NSM1_ADIRI|nr:unnamed protein product [Adineta ricciae]CAF1292631.1 unnamed protein product [Adineta ricciae]